MMPAPFWIPGDAAKFILPGRESAASFRWGDIMREEIFAIFFRYMNA